MRAWAINTFFDLKLTYRDKQALFWTYLFPLFFLFLFSAVFANGEAKRVAGLMPGLLCISAMSQGFFGLNIGIVSLRERGILRRYKLAPISSWQLLGSLLISNYLMTLSTLIFQLILARLFFRAEIAGNLLDLGLFLSVSILAFLTLGFVIASLAENTKVALVIANLLFFPFMFLGGAAIPKFLLPPTLQKVANFLPSGYAVDGLGRIIVDGESVSHNLFGIGVLLLTAIAAFTLAAKLFRWETNDSLTMGQKASLVIIVLIFVGAALLVR